MQGIPSVHGEGSPPKTIAIVLPGSGPIELVESIAELLTNFRVFLFANGLSPYFEKRLERLGISYTKEFEFFLLQAPSADLVLTFGALPHPAHIHVNIAISLFNELKTPVLDIQHGLFQWGISFTDTSLKQGTQVGAGCSLPMATTADQQIQWFGDDGIGYPRYTQDHAARQTSPPHVNDTSPILIATNTNWHIYQEEDRERFKRMLRRLFTDYPDIPFIWKPHPAEHNPKLSSIHTLFLDIKNEFLNVEVARPASEGGKTLTELVEDCRAGIVTVGTALLDFEMLGRPCLCYNSHAVKPLIEHMKQVRKFSSYEELIDNLPALKSSDAIPRLGYLKPFDPKLLHRYLDCQPVRSRDDSALRHCLQTISLARQVL